MAGEEGKGSQSATGDQRAKEQQGEMLAGFSELDEEEAHTVHGGGEAEAEEEAGGGGGGTMSRPISGGEGLQGVSVYW